jgi:hypothetical protein
MLRTQYSSNAESKSSKRKPKNPVSQLAKDSFEAFKPFINIFDCGLCYEGPFHTITKEDWLLYRRYKNGERNLTYASDGREFNPGRDIVANIYSPRHVQRHIEAGEVTYFTSGKNGLGLLYLDIDAHKPWQTDEYEAKAILQELFPFAYFRASRRGQNGFLKIQYSTHQEFNDLAERLEMRVRRLFLSRSILCDFEVNGTITTGDKSGSLGKFPFTSLCHMRDESDCWNYPQLRKFEASPIVNVRRVEYIMGQIEMDDDKAIAFFQHKINLEEEQKAVEEAKKPQIRTVVSLPSPVIVKKTSVKSATLRIKMELPPQDVEDAFRRNLKDLRPFVRAFYRQERRFPTTEEALQWLQTNGRYSGEWEDNFNRRAKRVEQILRFTERTFDAEMLSKGEKPSVSLELGRFSWWVRQHCGSTMTAHVADLRQVDPFTLTAPTSTISVPAKFVETVLTVAEFCVSTDPLSNKAVPTNRIKKIWGMVKGGATWNQKYYQIVRDRLHRMGVVSIFDRKHRVGKAWRWSVGKNMPAGNWKEEQRRLKEENRVQAELNSEEIESKQNNVHKTLYYNECQISAVSLPEEQVRPPP